jgi:hypothetical protein
MRRVFLAVLAGVLTVAIAPAANAAQVDPLLILGNPSCSGALTIQSPSNGVFGPITITRTDTAIGPEFGFTTDGTLVTGVIVKGGPNANFYDYSGLGGVTSDSGLHSPLNPSNNKWYGLSHLCFFTDDKKPPPPK